MSKKKLIASIIILLIAFVIAFFVEQNAIRIIVMCISAGVTSAINRKADV